MRRLAALATAPAPSSCRSTSPPKRAGLQAIPQVIAHLGGLDILVNNAGVEITSLLVDIDPAEVRRQLEVNVLGTALGLKHGFRAMRPGGPAGAGGSIVNVASVAATIAFPGIAIYSATKSAVDRLTKVAAMESGKLGYGVRVNCVYPGLVPTEMGNQLANDCATIGLFPTAADAAMAVAGLTPLGRLGEVAEIADAVVFLASDGAGSSPGPGSRSTAAWECEGGPGMSDTKKVVVYGASGYTGRLVCEYLREFNVPFIAAGRDKAQDRRGAGDGAGHRDRGARDRRGRARGRAAVGAVRRRQRGLQHGRAVRHLRRARWSRPAWPPAATTSTPPASRTG